MSWIGYFEYGGNEIINVARTEAYMKNARMDWFRPVYKAEALGFMLGDGLTYKTPLVDNAPWVDPDIPESLDFYGFYPLEVTGVEDSTRVSTVIEALGDGGVPGRLRNATRSVVFNGMLFAATECAASYGMKWLKVALSAGVCGMSAGSPCNGADLCYLDCMPDMDLPELTTDATTLTVALFDGGYFRTVDDGARDRLDGGTVTAIATETVDGGSTPASEYQNAVDGGVPASSGDTGGGEVTQIQVDDPDLWGGSPSANQNYQFDGGSPAQTGTFVTGKPYPFPPEEESEPGVADSCLDDYQRSLHRVLINNGPTVEAKREMSCDGGFAWNVQFTAVAGNPWEFGAEVPVIEGFMDPYVDDPWAADGVRGGVDLNGFLFDEGLCATPVYEAIYDPLCPALVPPPAPPVVPLSCYVAPTNWTRRQFTIPADYVPLWGEVVPKLSIHARTEDLRNLRIRFYADPFNVGDISDDPCSYCGDIVVSYIPQDHTLVLDGPDQVVYVDSPGGVRRRADALVFKTDGTPFEWPALSCGFGYIVTLDLPQTQATPVVDLSLTARAA